MKRCVQQPDVRAADTNVPMLHPPLLCPTNPKTQPTQPRPCRTHPQRHSAHSLTTRPSANLPVPTPLTRPPVRPPPHSISHTSLPPPSPPLSSL
eukprot:6031-Chlamydomonas_euryale.AAC.1